MLVVKKNHIRGDRDWEHTQYSGASFSEGFLRSPPATNCCSAGLNLTGPVRVPFLFFRLSALRQFLPAACQWIPFSFRNGPYFLSVSMM